MDYEEFDDSMVVSTPSQPRATKAAPVSKASRPISAAAMELQRRNNANAVAANANRQRVLSTESATEQYNKFIGKHTDLAANLRNRLQKIEEDNK